MGSGISKKTDSFEHITPLKCPEGYDTEKFKKICILFDRLDNNGDLQIELPELRCIAELHTKNNIIKLERRKKEQKKDLEVLLDELNKVYIKNKQKLEKDYNCEFSKINLEIEKLNRLTEKEKCVLFKNKITDGGVFTFDKFFHYVKNKTSDFKNISF